MTADPEHRAHLPSVDRLLQQPGIKELVDRHGHHLMVDLIRDVLADHRRSPAAAALADIVRDVCRAIDRLCAPSLKPVFNLTGTVLHTNLGRAVLPQAAIEDMLRIASTDSNLEYDTDAGRRGDRDDHVDALLRRLTGAEAATVVNNNAAAVLLVLSSLARRREVIVSRGELVEIGGAFRIPDIMRSAGAKLKDVGTTNRTHLRDYAAAVSDRSAMIMRVHTSNYEIQGFTAAVAAPDLARLARERDLPFAVDLGSGQLVDLSRFGLPHEATVAETLGDGADLVTFSGDKLLGGPQAGLIVGRADLIARIKKNPLKRALRVDKMTLAALAAVLRLYLEPDRLARSLPTLARMTRPLADIRAAAERLQPALTKRLADLAAVDVVDCKSQIGSGALPVDLLPSAALKITPLVPKRRRNKAAHRLAAAFRALPRPVIGRLHEGSLIFDLRSLEDEPAFVAQLAALSVH